MADHIIRPIIRSIIRPIIRALTAPAGSGGATLDPSVPIGLLAKLRSWYDFEDNKNDGWGAHPVVVDSPSPGSYADASTYGSGVSGRVLTGSNSKTRDNIPDYGTGKSYFMGAFRSQAGFVNDQISAFFGKNAFNDSLSLLTSAAGYRSRGVLDSAGPGVYAADTIDSTNTWTLTVAQHSAAGTIRHHLNNTFNAATNAGSANLNPTQYVGIGSPSGLAQISLLANLFWGEGELTSDELTYIYNGGAGRTLSEIVADASYVQPTCRFTQNLLPTYNIPAISFSGTRVGHNVTDAVTCITYTNVSMTSGKRVFAVRLHQPLLDSGSTFLGVRTAPGAPVEGGAFLNLAWNQTVHFFQNPPFTLGTAPGLSITAAGDVYMFAIDFSNLKLFVGKNGTWSGDPVAGTNPAFTFSSGLELFVWCQENEVQFGADFYFTTADYPYAVPSGFTLWGDA